MLQKLLVFTMLTFSVTLANAQDQVLPLYPKGNVPNYKKTDEVEKIDGGDIRRISYVQEPTLTVFLPSKANATGQGVVVCPGGGYAMLAWDWEGLDIAKWLNSKGIAAFVLKYRLPNSKSNVVRNESPLLDAKRAMRLVRANAAAWHVNRDQVGVMGFSAGGHLASTLGTHFDKGDSNAKDSVEQYSSRPDFMVLVYPVITMSKPEMHRGSRDNLIGREPNAELEKYYSNELQVTSETPPTFLTHASDDKGVPVENSLLFYKALVDHNVAAAMHIYPHGGHGFSLALSTPETRNWTDACIDWLRDLGNSKNAK